GGTRPGLHGAAEERVRAQELLLPRPAEGLSDLAVREPARDQGVAVVPVARSGPRDGDDRAAARRGGRREVAPRPLPQGNGDRSQPLRGAVERARHRPGPPLAPRGARPPPALEAGARPPRALP